jgi:two-component system cell cycle response regulator
MKTNNLSLAKDAQRRTLAGILREKDLEPGLPDGHREGARKAAIILLDHLSPQEREALNRIKHLVVTLEDDLMQRIMDLLNENGVLRSLALIDSLTGLYNSHYFSMQLDIEMARTRRTGLQCCLAMIDLDNFKALNDTCGHLEGNRFLVEVGKTFRECVRPTDIVCRYGGDEFAVIIPATGLLDATKTAERLRKAVWEMPKPAGLSISTSIGVAEYTRLSSWGPNEFIHMADSAMYDAKRNGKNRVASCGETEKADAWFGGVGMEERDALFALYER